VPALFLSRGFLWRIFCIILEMIIVDLRMHLCCRLYTLLSVWREARLLVLFPSICCLLRPPAPLSDWTEMGKVPWVFLNGPEKKEGHC
jgi:hypothetical protein